jgi:hypothetical protein
VIALALLLSLAAAEEPVVTCDPENPLHCSAPAVKGQPSLLDGQTLSVDLALFLGQKADNADALMRAERDRLEKLHQIDLTLQAAHGKADLTVATASTAAQKRVADYWEGRAKKAEERLLEGPPWYDHPVLWFSVGVVVTTVIVGIVASELHVIDKL